LYVVFFPSRTYNALIPGTDAEYVLIRSEAGVQVPDEVDAAKYAPLLCAGVAVFNSMRRMNVGPGETVAIQGLGGLGHLGVQYANRFGYKVVAISRGADKEKFARQLGAHEYIDTTKVEAGAALEEMGGVSLIVTTSPNAKQISELLRGLGPMGKLLILSCEIPDTLLRKTMQADREIVPGDVPFDTRLMVSVP
jgi:D-arabinose 1-dehydrogenase-like Zn-dependent alcohol dehydrogenase